jgi:hypothetical protein
MTKFKNSQKQECHPILDHVGHYDIAIYANATMLHVVREMGMPESMI